MSLSPISTPRQTPVAPRDTTGMGHAIRRPTMPATARPLMPSAPEAPAAPSEMPTPPADTDPALWRILTNEERQFFAAQEARGPLTYGHRLAERALVAPRGGRLNLRG